MNCGRTYFSRRDSLDAAFLIRLEEYLAEYCLKSLEEIKLTGIEPDRTATFQTAGVQFLNIRKVSAMQCYFADNFSFNANFPNVESLSIEFSRCTFNIQDWHFPTVKNLHFNCCTCKSSRILDRIEYAPYFSMVDLIEMFKRQPQLEKLDMYAKDDKFPPILAKCFNEHLPKLESLVLRFLSFRYIPRNFESVHLDHITVFSIRLDHLGTHQTIPFTFNRLECVEIMLEHIVFSKKYPDSAIAISEFIFSNKHLKKINLRGIRGDFQQLFQYEHILSNVEELSICGCKNVSSDIIERFLTQCQSLKLLRICGIDSITDALESKISEKIMHNRANKNIDKTLEFIFRNKKPIQCKNLD